MRHTNRVMTAAAVSIASLALAGCSGNAPETQATAAASASAEASAMPVEGASAMPAPEASSSAVAETAAAPAPVTKPSPSPSPSATEKPVAKVSVKAEPKPSVTPSPAPMPSPAAKVAEAAALTPPKAFTRCAVCHNVAKGAGSKIGPNLWGVYGTKAGDIAGYNFSDALKASGLTWNDATLDTWIEAPMKDVPGTYMSFPGIKDPAKRAEIIAFLKSAR